MKTHLLAAIILSSAIISGPIAAQTAAAPADTPPKVDTSGVNLQPAYPAGSTASGAVAIAAFVRDNGTVSRVAVAKSSGSSDLDTAAANAVMHWKFVPATEHGQPVSGRTVVQIVFQPPAAQ